MRSPAAGASARLAGSAAERERFGAALLRWYAQHARPLPWRRPPAPLTDGASASSRQGTPRAPLRGAGEEALVTKAAADRDEHAYRVWVSEVMCQQTQVSRVEAYFKRWVAKWPTVHELAGASIEEVNEMWAGLGYYRRARALLDGARYIVHECGGRMPETIEGLRAIPGVGTAWTERCRRASAGNAAGACRRASRPVHSGRGGLDRFRHPERGGRRERDPSAKPSDGVGAEHGPGALGAC
eukprot:scaffold2295_cov354-Prasinococcus_capsulatus_cf.AAC.7